MHLAYRNRFVLGELRNQDGWGTGAIFGSIGSIQKLQKQYPDHTMVFTWDTNPTLRKKIDKTYKANRDDRPDWYPDFQRQIKLLKEIIQSLGIAQYLCNGYEADDVAYHLVEKNPEKGQVLVTGDSDWLQLVNDENDVVVFNPRNMKVYNEEEVCKEHLVDKPQQIVFLKILKGDKSDNVPGIKRFPTKTALHIAKKYKDVLDLVTYAGIDDNINERWTGEIEQNKDRLYLNESLVKFSPLRRPIQHIKGKHDEENLLRLYRRLNFDKYKNEILKKKHFKKK